MTQACSTLSHIYYLTDTEHTPGTRCQWKAQSGMSKTALTLFSSLGLWSPAVLDGLSALKSSLALLACQAAEGTNGYLRSAAPLPPTMATPPHLLLLSQGFSSCSSCIQLPIPYSSPCLLFWSFLPPLVSPLSVLLPTIRPFSCSSAGYLRISGIVLGRTSCCSDLVRDQSVMPVYVEGSRGSRTSTQVEMWEALQQLSESERHTERHGAGCIVHMGSHRNYYYSHTTFVLIVRTLYICHLNPAVYCCTKALYLLLKSIASVTSSKFCNKCLVKPSNLQKQTTKNTNTVKLKTNYADKKVNLAIS